MHKKGASWAPFTSDGDGRLDAGMGVVTLYLEILELVIEDRVRLALDHQSWQRTRLTRELQCSLLHVVGVEVHIAAGPDKVAHFQTTLLGHHMGQQSIAGNVERQAEKIYATQKLHKTPLTLNLAPQNLLCKTKTAHFGGYDPLLRGGHCAKSAGTAPKRRKDRSHAPILRDLETI